MKPNAPLNPASLERPVQKAIRENAMVRAALARLRPADRRYASKAVADAILAWLRREGRVQ
jgi:hypothetical protein